MPQKQQQSQQQYADFDLLAIFPDETKAEAATTKLHKEGFTESEVHHIQSGGLSTGQFREHGASSARGEVFLQVQRAKPNPRIIFLFAVIFGLVLFALTFATTFAIPTLPEPTTLVVGAALGIVLGSILGLLQRGRVRGAIGQKVENTAPQKQLSTARTTVALRFTDPENISRKSRARAILLNNQGKIDRSVSRQE